MELKIGFKFQMYYGEDNINNVASCEVRGIVDDYIIVLWCEKDATKWSEAKGFYLSIDKDKFDFFVEKEMYLPI